MRQAEKISAFGRFGAATEHARIATDDYYDQSSEGVILFGATETTPAHTAHEVLKESVRLLVCSPHDDGIALVEKGSCVVLEYDRDYVWASLEPSVEPFSYDVTTSFNVFYVDTGIPLDFTWNDPLEGDPVCVPTLLRIRSGPADDPTKDLREIVDGARASGLDEIADRLGEISEQSLDDGELPLNADSVQNFVFYCLARNAKVRPLMTATPSGEIDATWTGPEKQTQLIRFFPDGSVWVAYKRTTMNGSFESTVTNLLDPSSAYKCPDWA